MRQTDRQTEKTDEDRRTGCVRVRTELIDKKSLLLYEKRALESFAHRLTHSHRP